MRRALLAIGLAALFGGADQYLGSLAGHPSATAASLLSAPWLLVAFLAGWSQPTPRRAMLLGVLCTIAALGGYWLMTLSPLEGAHLSMRAMRGLISSQSVLIVGAFVTGPLFGWLGNRWRSDRWRVGALALAAAVCLEPLAHAAVGSAIRSPGVWGGEVAVGVLMALYALVAHTKFGLARSDFTGERRSNRANVVAGDLQPAVVPLTLACGSQELRRRADGVVGPWPA